MSDPSTPPVHPHCQNCGTALQGHYCHQCGQHDLDLHRSFRHVFLEALENFLHFDAKFFRNIVTLLFRPGRLSADFNAGRRASQVPPFRLYLFVSIVFFFISFLAAEDAAAGAGTGITDGYRQAESEALRGKIRAETAGKLKQLSDRPETREIARAVAPAIEKSATDTPPATKPAVKEPRNRLELWLEEKGQYAAGHQRELMELFIHSLPKTLLFCLPFFALYTRVLFRKTGQNYLQHLVVALHFHTFVYLWWLVGHGWTGLLRFSWAGGADWMIRLTVIWLLLYPLLMLRRLYGNSWKLTVFKTGLLTLAYGLTLAVGVGLTAAVAFFLV